MMRRIMLLASLTTLVTVTTLLPTGGTAHAATLQAGRARYVGPSGWDWYWYGRWRFNDCLSISSPCRTINHTIAMSDPGDVILAACGLYEESINIDRSLSLLAQTFGSTCVWIDPPDGQRGVFVASGLTAALTDITIANATTATNGAGVYVDRWARVVLERVRVRDNRSSQRGGGIFNYYGELTVTDCTLNDNEADRGGGIYNYAGTMTVTNSTLSGNRADADRGGGIYNTVNGTVDVTNSTLGGNRADAGGGIYNGEGTLTVTNSTLSGNKAYDSGGGIHNRDGMLTVTNGTLSGNKAYDSGGGISNDVGGTVTVANSTLSANEAEEGGGINNYAGTLTVTNSTLSGNSADTGGGIRNSGGGIVVVTNSTLSANEAEGYGGGTYNRGGLTMLNSTLVYNGAATAGGIYNASAGQSDSRNMIIALNTNGDCANDGIFQAFSVNLDSDGSCRNFSLSNQHPVLGPLQNNGGPTFTHMPEPTSPALDVGSPDACADGGNVDQRGYSRINADGNGNPSDGNLCDLGAVERNASPAPPTGTNRVFLPIVLSQHR